MIAAAYDSFYGADCLLSLSLVEKTITKQIAQFGHLGVFSLLQPHGHPRLQVYALMGFRTCLRRVLGLRRFSKRLLPLVMTLADLVALLPSQNIVPT